MRKLLVTAVVCAAIGSANAQVVKVLSNGNVGIGLGTNTPTHKLHVAGSSTFNGYVGVGKLSSAYRLDVTDSSRFGDVILGTYKPNCSYAPSYYAIYSTTDNLLLGTPNNWVYTTFSKNVYYAWSGTTAEKPIDLCSQPILPPINRINTYQRVWSGTGGIILGNGKGSTEEPMEYIFDPEELQTVFPALVSVYDTCDSGNPKYAINYTGMVPILTAAIKEQQQIIEIQQGKIGILQNIAIGQEKDLLELRKTVNELHKIILICCKESGYPYRQDSSSNNNNNLQNEPILYQNTPNPFSSNTDIACEIPTSFNSAFIYIYNLQGVELMSFPITQTGYTVVTVYASSLPAGMYLYTLVVDNVIIDTKRMILTK